jgi:hypothetical protein
MPKGEGIGPMGPGAGRGLARGSRGRMGDLRKGPVGNCVCPSCGTTVPHQAGVPCYQMTCPKCGTKMVRK